MASSRSSPPIITVDLLDWLRPLALMIVETFRIKMHWCPRCTLDLRSYLMRAALEQRLGPWEPQADIET